MLILTDSHTKYILCLNSLKICNVFDRLSISKKKYKTDSLSQNIYDKL